MDRLEVLELIRSVLQNTFVTFGELLFQQIRGVPMGNNASPIIADLTLSAIEFRYLNTNLHSWERSLLQYTTRFIDDLLSIGCPYFLELCQDIYPDSLPLENTTNASNYSHYLDFTINYSPDGHQITLYNKTDCFNFAAKCYIYADSNTHSNLGYNTFYTQLIRIARTCTRLYSYLCSYLRHSRLLSAAISFRPSQSAQVQSLFSVFV